MSSVEAETVKLALNNTTTGTPMEVEEPDDPDELPLSKRCRVSKAEKRLLNLVDDIVKVNKSSQSPSERARAEVKRHTEEESSADSPLEWWTNHTRFPYLSVLAKKYLAVPATSVPAERAFSIAGHIVSQKRSCLLPENVNRLVFLAENLKL